MKSGFVYLIANTDVDGVFKIGVTKDDVYKRLKKLQTGNSGELFLVNYHKSDYPFFVEHMLHNRFFPKKKLNEWFELTDEQALSFKKECESIEEMIAVMKDNPFFAKELNR